MSTLTLASRILAAGIGALAIGAALLGRIELVPALLIIGVACVGAK